MTPESIVIALISDMEGRIRLAECLGYDYAADILKSAPGSDDIRPCPGQMEVSPECKSILVQAQDLASADGVPDRRHPGFINIAHLSCAMAMSWDVCHLLHGRTPINRDRAVQLLDIWDMDIEGPEHLSDLIGRLRELRRNMLERIYGQDHAIYTFIEGLYEAELSGGYGAEQKRPSAIFVFAGPPGVGKTYSVELASVFLERPFKRYDMTSYSDHQSHNQLVGFAPSFKDAHAGLLTGFVEQNPNAILLFDEIEKAHLNVIQFFYQILDVGLLEDKFTERDVSFRDTIIVFTTNAGRVLYDNINKSGIVSVGSTYHKQTILSALENEKNPTNGLPVFPPAICSRLSQGFPVLFNHLGVNELARVSESALQQTASRMERRYFKKIEYDDLIPITMVLNGGYRSDAREVGANSARFLKTGLLTFINLFEEIRLEKILKGIKKIRYELDPVESFDQQEIRVLYEPIEQQTVLLIANETLAETYTDAVPSVKWHVAANSEEALELIALKSVDMVLLDLWVNASEDIDRTVSENTLVGGQDYVPFFARALKQGRGMLRNIRRRFPDLPVYLLSIEDQEKNQGKNDAETIAAELVFKRKFLSVHRLIDEELFLECFRAGGARGVLRTALAPGRDGQEHKSLFGKKLDSILRKLYRESQALRLSKERKNLTYELVPRIDHKREKALILLRNFRLQRVVNAEDASELVNDIERPATRFEDVYGAYAAKESSRFIIDWLIKPKRYAALGVRAPKGILLSGPPGTGKTMIARAVAGESECAFIEKSATSFVTVWQGSGPQNVRDLFARARRYAPAIVFIDEIDAIGIARSAGFSRSAEETLNALLTEMDGFSDASLQPVIVIGATNLPESLDPALRRRFDRILDVEKPDREARLAYLTDAILKRKGAAVQKGILEGIASRSTGMTIADLERILQEAGVMAVQANQMLNDGIIEEAFEKIRMGEAHKIPDKKILERIARHEAGHTLLSCLGGHFPMQVTIVGRGGAGGYMEREIDEDRILYTKSELEQRICESMGGRAAEILYYGDTEGLSTGVSGDLSNATYWAQKMVKEFGMAEEFEAVALPDNQKQTDGPIAFKVIEKTQIIIKAQLNRAISLLADNRKKLDLLSGELLQANRLSQVEIKKIMEM